MAMKNHNTVYLGTELKLKVSIDPVDNHSMSTYNFDIEAYCNENSVVTASKRGDVLTNLVSISGDTDAYLALVDTSIIGVGRLKCRVIAYIPDEDFPDDYRTEIDVLDPGIIIIK